VLNLWASWCTPCAREMPLLQRMAASTQGTVAFLGVDTEDEREQALQLLAYTKVTYPSLFDPDGKVRSSVRAPGLPLTLVFSADGQQVLRHVGEINQEQLQQGLRRAGAAT